MRTHALRRQGLQCPTAEERTVIGEDTAVGEDGVVNNENGGVLGELAGQAAAGRVEVQPRAQPLLHALQRLSTQACHQARLSEPARRHIPALAQCTKGMNSLETITHHDPQAIGHFARFQDL